VQTLSDFLAFDRSQIIQFFLQFLETLAGQERGRHSQVPRLTDDENRLGKRSFERQASFLNDMRRIEGMAFQSRRAKILAQVNTECKLRT
jgi:hypothetical protein